MAIAQRQPEPGLIAHSDRGSQYAGAAYQALLSHQMGDSGLDSDINQRAFWSPKWIRKWPNVKAETSYDATAITLSNRIKTPPTEYIHRGRFRFNR
ncbi:integrase catalytic subunit [Pseudomonas syringae pv. actinidiae ICMP 19071]|nr:integrase catalytic subunit [Pseudomonas syringae pv. actinidiae ICMP 19071]